MVGTTSALYPNGLKRCIKQYGFKMNDIITHLAIPSRTLSDYVNGHVRVPRSVLERIADYIGCSIEQLEAPFPPWNVPYRRNPFFTGREEVLASLRSALSKSTIAIAHPQAFCGLGGIGKTQIAIEYAYRYRDEYLAVFWVKADTSENLVSDFLRIAHLLDLPEQHAQSQDTTLAAVRRWLQMHYGWLLIFDNADDLPLVDAYLPAGARGHILLTTRAQALGRLAHRIDVGVMDPQTSILFLLRRAAVIAPDASLHDVDQSAYQAASELARELGYLPLALDQAAAYMEETHCDLATYISLYRSHRLALLSRRGGLVQDHPEPVATTWSLSFQHVKRENPAAADLLRLCAFLDPDAIPEELITNGAGELGEPLGAVASEPFLLNQATLPLSRYSLVRRHSETHLMSMHRLVQVVLREQMGRDEQRNWAEQAVRAVSHAFPQRIEMATWPTCQRLLPQASVCVALLEEWDLAFPEAAFLLNQAAYYLREHARYAQAEQLYQRALALRERVLGTSCLETAQSQYNLARLYFDQGSYLQAEWHYRQALLIRQHLLGETHVDVAACLNSLALLYWSWGVKLDEAEQLYQQALSFFEQTVGTEHALTAHCLNNLALLYVTQERYLEAEQLHQRVLTLREQYLAPIHLDTAQSLQNLAGVFVAAGWQERYGEAMALLARSLAIREQLLGAEHPQTAKSLHNLALLCEAQGQYEEAETRYRQVIAIRERVFGPENAKTKGAISSYYLLLRKMGRSQEADSLEKRYLLHA